MRPGGGDSGAVSGDPVHRVEDFQDAVGVIQVVEQQLRTTGYKLVARIRPGADADANGAEAVGATDIVRRIADDCRSRGRDLNPRGVIRPHESDFGQRITILTVAAESAKRKVIGEPRDAELEIGRFLQVSGQQSQLDVLTCAEEADQLVDARQDVHHLGANILLEDRCVRVETTVQQIVDAGVRQAAARQKIPHDLPIRPAGEGYSVALDLPTAGQPERFENGGAACAVRRQERSVDIE